MGGAVELMDVRAQPPAQGRGLDKRQDQVLPKTCSSSGQSHLLP